MGIRPVNLEPEIMDDGKPWICVGQHWVDRVSSQIRVVTDYDPHAPHRPVYHADAYRKDFSVWEPEEEFLQEHIYCEPEEK